MNYSQFTGDSYSWENLTLFSKDTYLEQAKAILNLEKDGKKVIGIIDDEHKD